MIKFVQIDCVNCGYSTSCRLNDDGTARCFKCQKTYKVDIQITPLDEPKVIESVIGADSPAYLKYMDWKLIYIDHYRHNVAWFQDVELASEADGYDWHKGHYEYNCDGPRLDDKHVYFKVCFECTLDTPAERLSVPGVSINYINLKGIPWLARDDSSIQIWAGTTLVEFIELIRQAEGEVYIPLSSC